MGSWRYWLGEGKTLLLWSRATGTSIERSEGDIPRKDFIKESDATTGQPDSGTASPRVIGDTSWLDDLWVPPDDDLRWSESDWTGLRGFALITPDLIEDDDGIARGSFSSNEYKRNLKNWRLQDLVGSLTGQRATIVHGDPSTGRDLSLDRFALEDERRLQGKYKLPLTWSLMYQELVDRDLKDLNEILINFSDSTEISSQNI